MHKKSLIRFLIFVFAITLLGHFGLSNIYKKTDSQCSQPIENLILDIQKNMLEEENAVWDIITTQTGVTKEQCLFNREDYAQEEKEFYRKENLKMLEKNPKKLSITTQQLVKEVFQDFDINPESVTIIPIKTNFSPAGADDWALYVDEEKLLSYIPDAQYFILGHELGHIKFKDISLRCALNRLISQKNKDPKEMLDLCSSFQEKRADMFAFSRGDKYVSGGIAFFNSLKQQKGDNFGPPSHPKITDRIAWAEDIPKLYNLPIKIDKYC